MKTTTALVSATFIAAVLTACGADDDRNNYCESLQSADSAFSDIYSSDGKRIEAALDEVHSIARQAPPAVEDDWKIVDAAVTQLRKNLDAAGVSLADLAQSGREAPDTPDPAMARRLAQSVQELASAKVTKANEQIAKHAKSECHIDLKDGDAA